jgi:hypothetical protein
MAPVGLGRGSGNFWWHGHLRPIWVRSRSLLPPPYVRIFGWMAESMVLSEELGYGVAKRDLCKLQPLREVIEQLLHLGLTHADLLRNFFSRWVTTMWMYSGPSCPDCPS